MNNTVENRFFEFPKGKLATPGEVDKFVKFASDLPFQKS